MRLTYPQLGMHALLGDRLFSDEEALPLSEVIRGGHGMLVDVLGIDLGYDPRQWHEYLCAFDEGGYCWSDEHLQFPHRIEQVLADPTWRDAVRELAADRPAAARAPDDNSSRT